MLLQYGYIAVSAIALYLKKALVPTSVFIFHYTTVLNCFSSQKNRLKVLKNSTQPRICIGITVVRLNLFVKVKVLGADNQDNSAFLYGIRPDGQQGNGPSIRLAKRPEIWP